MLQNYTKCYEFFLEKMSIPYYSNQYLGTVVSLVSLDYIRLNLFAFVQLDITNFILSNRLVHKS